MYLISNGDLYCTDRKGFMWSTLYILWCFWRSALNHWNQIITDASSEHLVFVSAVVLPTWLIYTHVYLHFQGRPLRVHEYTFVSPWFFKAYTCIEKLSSRAFQWYMTLLYRHVIYIYRWKALERYFSTPMLKSCPPNFAQWAPLILKLLISCNI